MLQIYTLPQIMLEGQLQCLTVAPVVFFGLAGFLFSLCLAFSVLLLVGRILALAVCFTLPAICSSICIHT